MIQPLRSNRRGQRAGEALRAVALARLVIARSRFLPVRIAVLCTRDVGMFRAMLMLGTGCVTFLTVMVMSARDHMALLDVMAMTAAAQPAEAKGLPEHQEQCQH